MKWKMKPPSKRDMDRCGEEQQPRDSIACLRNSKMVNMVAAQGRKGRRQRIDEVSKLFKASLMLLNCGVGEDS